MSCYCGGCRSCLGIQGFKSCGCPEEETCYECGIGSIDEDEGYEPFDPEPYEEEI